MSVNTSNYGWAFIHPVYGQAQARGPIDGNAGAIQFQTAENGGPDNNGIGVGSGSANFTYNPSSNLVNLTGDLVVGGNLTVNGDTVVVDASTLIIEDPLIGLGYTTGNPSADTGSAGDRGLIMGLSGSSDGAAGMIWDNSATTFAFVRTDSVPSIVPPGAHVNITSYADLNIGTTLKLSHAAAGPHATVEVDSDGDLNIKATHTNADITFTVDEAGTDIIALTIDGSDNGSAKFTPANNGYLSVDDAGTDGYVKIMGNGGILAYKHTDTSANAPLFYFLRTRGDESSQSALSDGDLIGRTAYYGYDTNTSLSALIDVYADGDHGGSATDSPGRFEFRTAEDGSGTVQTRMTIKSDGKVGIGTTAPAMPLHVVNSAGGRVMLHRSAQDTSGQLGSIMFGANDGDTNLAMVSAYHDGATDSAFISFETEVAGGSMAERLRIASGGNVGIGVTNPSQLLDVNGTATVDGFQIASSTVMTDIKDEDSMSSDSATALATQQSIKAYVDSTVGAVNLLVRAAKLAGNVDHNIDLDSEDLILSGTADEIIINSSEAASAPNDVTISYGLADFGPNSGGSNTEYGSATHIPKVTIDGKGRVASVALAQVNFHYTIATGGGSIEIGSGDTLQLTGSANEIDVSVSDLGDGSDLTEQLIIGLATNPTLPGNATVTGNLSVDGNTTLGNASSDSITLNASTVSTPNGLNFDTDTLVIDQANNRIGIGKAAPEQPLHIYSNTNNSDCSVIIENANTGGSCGVHFRSGVSDVYAIGVVKQNNNFRIAMGTHLATDAHSVLEIQNSNVGIGTVTPNEKLTVEGAISLDHISSPSATSGYGKLYAKSDNKLYFMDAAGTETDLLSVETTKNYFTYNPGSGGGTLAQADMASKHIVGVITNSSATGNIQIDLPSASGNAGRHYIIKDEGGHADVQNVIVNAPGSETLDGASNHSLKVGFAAVNVYSNGSNWFVF